MPTPGRTLGATPPSARSNALALALSGASLLASAACVFLVRRAPAPAGHDGTGACEDAALRREVDELRRGLAGRSTPGGGPDPQLARQVVALQAEVDALRVAAAGADGGAAPPAAPPVHFVGYTTPSSAVSMRTTPTGSFQITNTDPALTGQTMLVQAKGDDGTQRTITITVPPPAP